ncbi:hypothetical protein, conserved [Plasmodium gonderi]|uniref:Uncharacterized protein n=1 Tax=Plasmodium gonderi TaxID=77519 RepID=A0A1Y1JP38_PLAGO|nr:hypothetical protein, conserved [Plasmodium gonderi]GAW81814.1 hypothetical protein, conserved [Plasmodium gonderi]
MYVDLHLKYSSKKNVKALISKALNVGFSITAIGVQYEADNRKVYCESFKLVNCLTYNKDVGVDQKIKSSSGNYFIDQLNNEEEIREQLVQISSNLEGNYILVNRCNTLSLKYMCDDFILRDKNQVSTKEELNKLNEYLMNAITIRNSNLSMFLSENTNNYVLKRLNIKYEDAVRIDNYNKFIKNNDFDLVAIEINTVEEINYIATKLDCDIIFFNMKKSFVQLKKSDIQTALDRGIFFEISSITSTNEDFQYYPTALNINSIFSTIPFNKIIVSSGAFKESEVIEPLNLLRLFFNFNKFSYKDLIGSITTVPLTCIQRASVRKSSNTAVFHK